MNYGSIPYPDSRKIRFISAVTSFAIHVLLLMLFSFITLWRPKTPDLIELDWGSSSGAPNQSILQAENNPNRQQESAQAGGSPSDSKINVPEMKSPSEEVIPVAKKKKPKAVLGERNRESAERATTPRYRRERSGTAGGAGKSTGYSIEWSGTGSRRLLSGRIPTYPEGTDKEMPVLLQFTVLPDGSVSSIIPLKRSDELLEREAVSALRTWRFDPLPPQFEQKTQNGIVTFIFKLE
ncbi:MAG: energy transducer TonB [Ignavibacteriae bacterium]|nr:energy transducer TonB [Ignavibacteriota bacterium]